jgi:carboxyl-terminal processing protease
MMKILSVFVLLSVTFIYNSNLVWGSTLIETNEQTDQIQNSDRTIREVVEFVHFRHLSGVSKENLEAEAIQGMLESLNDSYAKYYTADEWQKEQSFYTQQYVGIGIQKVMTGQTLKVSKVYPNSPAAEAGIQKDDLITHVNGEAINEKDPQAVEVLLVGEVGSELTLKVMRENEPLSFKLTRRVINYPTVESHSFDNHIGYIKITHFGLETDEEFSEQLQLMKEKGASSLILDLRSNPGGDLQTTINIAKHFIRKGIMIYVRSNTDVTEPVVILDGQELDMQVYILMNEYSASASEVLAGALQYQINAVVIGQQSYGKGQIQEMYELSNGGMLKFTAAEYLKPDKQPVHGFGINPDIVVEHDALQLVTALREAGMDHWWIEWKDSHMSIHDYLVHDPNQIVLEEDRAYISLRLLAALTHGTLHWEAESQTITLKNAKQESIFEQSIKSEKLKIENNLSYIDVEVISTLFDSVQWKDNGNAEYSLQIK